MLEENHTDYAMSHVSVVLQAKEHKNPYGLPPDLTALERTTHLFFHTEGPITTIKIIPIVIDGGIPNTPKYKLRSIVFPGLYKLHNIVFMVPAGLLYTFSFGQFWFLLVM